MKSLDLVLRELAETLRIERPLTVLDVETTGTNTRRDHVVQFAASSVTPSGEVTHINEFINPEMPIPAEVTAIHHITDSDVKDKPAFREHAQSLADQLTGHDFVAYNHRFDRDVLTAEFERAERRATELAAAEPVNDQVIAYLNRLSDHLFVMARYLNDGGKKDVLWNPGANR